VVSSVDLATLVGFLIAFGALIVSTIWESGFATLVTMFKPTALLLIIGGTIGATVIGYRRSDISKLPGLIKSAFIHKEQDTQDLIERIVRMAEKARREGLLALQDDIASLDNPLLVRGVQLIVDGTDPEIVRQTMETQVELAEERQMNAAGALDAAGGYAPTIGIIGTVIGLVSVLSEIGDAAKLAHSISLAFLATLWGILTANLFWLPLASKVKQNIQHETLIGRMCISGVSGLQTGEAPRALRDKLEVFISEAVRRERRRGGDEE
ncbi:MAG TPA: MotA/TolQ/ExbB proton channel family protein, partial [Symbiobacteriaceae bacterium]|nr:MotA/TolQ/ExbB proton channel family protein [Symbiobacteriaceae bacterium]